MPPPSNTCTIPQCTKSFRTRIELKAHKLTHGDRPYTCHYDGCKKAFKNYTTLSRHERTHTNEKPYQCSYETCKSVFKRLDSLDKHQQIHTEKPYQCSYDGCTRSFKERDALSEHHRLHTNEKPYQCSYDGCTRAFKRLDTLREHQRIHTNERPYRCSYDGCNSSFKKQGTLTIHQRTHTKEKTYKCDFDGCESAFTTSGALADHIRTHTNERPYRCSVHGCDSSFKQRSALKDHLTTHQGLTPKICCSKCDYEAPTSKGLRIHSIIHKPIDEQYQYICDQPDCQFAANYSSSLSNHKKSFHTTVGIAARTQQRKKQEEAVCKVLTKAGIQFQRELRIDLACAAIEGKCFYIDFVIPLGDVTMMLEIDEDGHRHYPVICETIRPFKIYESLALGGSTQKVGFIRFNPHAFRLGGTLQKRTPKKARYAELVNVIQTWEQYNSLQVKYMYYDRFADGRLCISEDPQYAVELDDVLIN